MTAVQSEPEKELQELPRWLHRLQEGEDVRTLVLDLVETARRRTHAQTALIESLFTISNTGALTLANLWRQPS